MASTVRIGTAQPKSRLIDYKIRDIPETLARVDENIAALAELVDQAGKQGCDVIALPEDTLGLGQWEAGNPDKLVEALPTAVERMLERLAAAAAKHNMYLVCCNDTAEPDGTIHNTAFLVGRDGNLIGRYRKVNMPLQELTKARGEGFPVFQTPDLGGVGMLICYDMVFPEGARCLTLNGADIIFHPTLGGAAMGNGELSDWAFRVRAVENFTYIVVSWRGGGSRVISPKGEVLAKGSRPDEIVIADIDPFGGRTSGDACNTQRDMRARLFRERSPEACAVMTDPHAPIMDRLPETMSIEEIARIGNAMLTTGQEAFKDAEDLMRAGESQKAAAAFESLVQEFPATWIDRASKDRLAKL